MTDVLKLAEEALDECKTYISLYELGWPSSFASTLTR